MEKQVDETCVQAQVCLYQHAEEALVSRRGTHRASAEAGCLSRMCTRTLSADRPTRSPHSGQHRGSGFVFFICAVVDGAGVGGQERRCGPVW